MNNLGMTHPWMSLIIILSLIEGTQSVIKYITGWHKSDKEVLLELLKELKDADI